MPRRDLPTFAATAVLLLTTLAVARPKPHPPELISLQLNPNRATQAELQLLPRIGPTLAAGIVRARQERPFENLSDLDRVPRIGPRTIAALTPWTTLADPIAHKEVP